MYVSPRPLRQSSEYDRTRPWSGLRSGLTYAVVALLAVGGVILLSNHETQRFYSKISAIFGP